MKIVLAVLNKNLEDLDDQIDKKRNEMSRIRMSIEHQDKQVKKMEEERDLFIQALKLLTGEVDGT